MKPRIAIPVPLSRDAEYVERSLPQYERAVEMAGGEPVRVPLDRSADEIRKIVSSCQGVLLPGSSADVDPAQYGAERNRNTNDPDPKRDAVDALLLEDAFRRRKPIVGICYGLQSLNVHRKGSLVQHIESPINHAIGRKVAVAHEVMIDSNSGLAKLLGEESRGSQAISIPVNSSHHQSADALGEGLRVVARCPQDGIVEAIEGTSLDHFILAVQWHPERSVDGDEPSRAIFRALVEAAEQSLKSR